jgi:hypothetical protein
MTKHRTRPSEEKLERNAERHLRFPADAITKSDRNFTNAEGATAMHNRFESNFETAGGWREFQ